MLIDAAEQVPYHSQRSLILANKDVTSSLSDATGDLFAITATKKTLHMEDMSH